MYVCREKLVFACFPHPDSRTLLVCSSDMSAQSCTTVFLASFPGAEGEESAWYTQFAKARNYRRVRIMGVY